MLIPRILSLDQLRGAQRVKDREAERSENETSSSRPAPTTSTKSPAKDGYIFSGPLGPLPSVYGNLIG
jgi:hypothetical protein